MADAFFDEPEEQSLLKSDIVVSYFLAWSRIMAKRTERIGYFDFYAGPGRYETGQLSTPLLILEKAAESDELAQRLVALFNDRNPAYATSLEAEMANVGGIERLRYKPQVLTGEVDDEVAKDFEEIKTIPALSFIDPWGYKGLSLRLIHSVVKDWGCEVIFFFNYNRINMGIMNPLVQSHMEGLFGAQRLERLRAEIPGLTPRQRETAVHAAIEAALEEMGAPYLLPFKFRRQDGRLSHSICFVSKSGLGYRIMKEVMSTRGVVDEDGVPRFEHLPTGGGAQLVLGEDRPILRLATDLMNSFAGQTISVADIYGRHNVGTQFIKRNYKKLIMEFEQTGKVTCQPDAQSRRAGTCADGVLVTFPARA